MFVIGCYADLTNKSDIKIESSVLSDCEYFPHFVGLLSQILMFNSALHFRLFIILFSFNAVGASEANLIHVHAAVYALFLCLYGMYPCYFMKYLQQYFHIGSPSSKGMVVVQTLLIPGL